MRVRLSKILGGERIRTDTVEGEAYGIPEVGKSFMILSESYKIIDGIRQTTTSTVQEVKEIGFREYEIRTMNSTYKVEILDL